MCSCFAHVTARYEGAAAAFVSEPLLFVSKESRRAAPQRAVRVCFQEFRRNCSSERRGLLLFQHLFHVSKSLLQVRNQVFDVFNPC